MTRDEARQVAEVLVTADGNCHSCGADLFVAFDKAFPSHRDVLNEVWEQEHYGPFLYWPEPT